MKIVPMIVVFFLVGCSVDSYDRLQPSKYIVLDKIIQPQTTERIEGYGIIRTNKKRNDLLIMDLMDYKSYTNWQRNNQPKKPLKFNNADKVDAFSRQQIEYDIRGISEFCDRKQFLTNSWLVKFCTTNDIIWLDSKRYIHVIRKGKEI